MDEQVYIGQIISKGSGSPTMQATIQKLEELTVEELLERMNPYLHVSMTATVGNLLTRMLDAHILGLSGECIWQYVGKNCHINLR